MIHGTSINHVVIHGMILEETDKHTQLNHWSQHIGHQNPGINDEEDCILLVVVLSL